MILTQKSVREALRGQYGARGYRIHRDGRVLVRVNLTGRVCWMPFGSAATPEGAAALAAHPLWAR